MRRICVRSVDNQMDVVLIGLLLLLSFVISWFWQSRSSAGLPPGPRGLPFLGNLFLLGDRPSLTLYKWAKQYGPIISIPQKEGPMIVLSDVAVARQVYSNDDVTGRPGSSLRKSTEELPQGYGLSHSNGEIWKIHRRFALSTLRNLGINSTWLEDSILHEIDHLCKWLKESNQQPIYPKPHISMCVANIMCAFLFRQQFPVGDPQFQRLTELVAQNMMGLKVQPYMKTFPFLRWFPNRFRAIVERSFNNRLQITAFLKEFIKNTKEKDVPDDEASDYIQAYLLERKTGEKTSAKHLFDEPQLINSLLDMFNGGSETTAATMMWTFIFMLENPEVLKRIQADIDNNVGRDKFVRGSDRSKLPYIEATVLEVLRLATLVPLSGAMALKPVQVAEYSLPKETFIGLDIYSIHRDGRYWENPEKFDPSRFLDENDKVKKQDGFAPFGIGKRDCLAQVLVKTELFLFLANIFRCFSVEIPPGQSVTRNDYMASSTDFHIPLPYDLIFIPREGAF